jgi:hypothetical protein
MKAYWVSEGTAPRILDLIQQTMLRWLNQGELDGGTCSTNGKDEKFVQSFSWKA